MKGKIIEATLSVLEWLAHRLGFGLVPLGEAEALANEPIPFGVGEPDGPPAILDSWPPRDELGRTIGV